MKILKRIQEIKNIGNNRQLYNEQWVETKKALERYAIEDGLKVSEDIIGNLFCRLEGYNRSKTISIISHFDSVENGGAYDGIVGILAGIEALGMLKKKFGTPEVSLEVICIAEEEGARFKTTFLGCRALFGDLKYENLKRLKDKQNISFFKAREVIGLKPFSQKELDRCQRNDIITAIELHVEQSRYLEKTQIPIGICTHIPGQMKIRMVIVGEANHAGTTPMFERKDALCCAAKIISFVEHLGIKYEGVTTTGYTINAKNATNIIPSKVELIHDMRHHDPEVFNQMLEDLTNYAKREEEKRGVHIEFEKLVKIEPVELSTEINEQIKKVTRQIGLRQMEFKSGAGHDVQIMSSHDIPSGLIFIPSVEGISHRMEEYTKNEDIVNGLNVLALTIKNLSYGLIL
ncbi:M20 family metallo-hydrolase [Anaerosacchariphilus polymeriproducens]|uniref:Zn-dependent hydrolase n=1 Tax=Anaerosacchariphilus polymeriproducens TaxID=1812858 RepID=A0A371AWY3_9FIRM|nr:M20 family metallo-hydrolase [Anaerosacchariphilus polymeriproducens]RDU24088.1 Zn-dependent hydrolase [Anaerosacchariphilus polymeriproducens]